MPIEEHRSGCPPFIYGTAWKEERTKRLVERALQAGFRGFDTANQRKHYHEAGVGEAIRGALDTGFVTRQDLFLQTKYTFVEGQDNRLPFDTRAPVAEQVKQSFQSSLDHLGVDYLDSYLLHGPKLSVGLDDEDWEAWRAMESLQLAGKTRAIGVSNVSSEQLLKLIVAPAFVQNRCFAVSGWDAAVRKVCSSLGVIYQGFSLLTANRDVLRNQALRALAKHRGWTPAQIVFRFAQQLGMVPLTGTANPAHMRRDLETIELYLDEREMALVGSL